MTMYEVYKVLIGNNGLTINKIIEVSNGSREEVKFYLDVLIKLHMITRITPTTSGIIGSLRAYSDDDIIYKKN